MGAQEIVIVAIALVAGGYLIRSWVASAKRGTCGGCGCGCGDKPPSDESSSIKR